MNLETNNKSKGGSFQHKIFKATILVIVLVFLLLIFYFIYVHINGGFLSTNIPGLAKLSNRYNFYFFENVFTFFIVK